MEKEELRTLIKKIAHYLEPNEKWFLGESPYGGTVLSNPSAGMVLAFRQESSNRLEIRGSFGSNIARYRPYRGDPAYGKTEITVSLSKSPEKIARDITTRLLPPYKRMLAYALEGRRKDDEYKAHKKAILEKLIVAYGFDASIHPRDENVIYGYEPYRFEAKHWTGDDIDIRITLPIDTATKVLEYIKLNSGSTPSPETG